MPNHSKQSTVCYKIYSSVFHGYVLNHQRTEGEENDRALESQYKNK